MTGVQHEKKRQDEKTYKPDCRMGKYFYWLFQKFRDESVVNRSRLLSALVSFSNAFDYWKCTSLL